MSRELSFDKLKISLVHYFLKVEKYKAKRESSEQTSYLANISAKYPLIVISLVDFDEEKINIISSSLKTAKHEKIKVLKIALSQHTSREDNDFIAISEPLFFKDALKAEFPKISNLMIKLDDIDEPVADDSPEEIVEMLKNPENSKNKELRELTSKIRTGFTPVAFLLIALFVGGPAVAAILAFWFASQGTTYLQNGKVAAVFFGATDRNLTVLANQWWRILTFGINDGSSQLFVGIIEVIVIAILIYSNARYTEAAVGSLKLFVSFFVAYIITGLFVSAIPRLIFGGPYVALSAIVGILGFSTAKKGGAVSVISRSKMIVPIILLLLIPMFDGNIGNYLILILSTGLSGSVIFLWNYNYKHISYELAAPSIVLGICLVLPFTLFFAYSPTPAFSGEDIYAIQSYLTQGWIKTGNSATQILNHIGWTTLSFSHINGIWEIMTKGDVR